MTEVTPASRQATRPGARPIGARGLRISTRQLFTMGLVLFLIAFLAIATTYNYQARMMPIIIGVPVLLLAVLQVVIEYRESGARGLRDASADAKDKPKEAPATRGRVHVAKAYAWTLLAFAGMYLVGFTITTFVYPLLYMRFVGGRSWRMSAGISLIALAFVYVVMVALLNVQLYEGVIVVALRKAIYGY